MNTIKIKKALSKDIEIILKLMKEYFQHDSIDWNANIPKGLKKLLQNKQLGQVWLIDVDKKSVGYLILTFGFDLEFGGAGGLITDLYVQEDFRGQGLGEVALEACQSFCQKKKIKVLELQVEKSNKKAQRFYQKYGFTAHERIPYSMML